MMSHDISIDIDDVLQKAVQELNTDLVVMASHVPGLKEYVLASRAGYLASHAEISVMVVRWIASLAKPQPPTQPRLALFIQTW